MKRKEDEGKKGRERGGSKIMEWNDYEREREREREREKKKNIECHNFTFTNDKDVVDKDNDCNYQ